jgi:hypothetical protein
MNDDGIGQLFTDRIFKDVAGLVAAKLDPASLLMLCLAFDCAEVLQIDLDEIRISMSRTVGNSMYINETTDRWMFYRRDVHKLHVTTQQIIRAMLQRNEDVLHLLTWRVRFTYAFNTNLLKEVIKNDDMESLRLVIRFILDHSEREQLLESAIKNDQLWIIQCLIDDSYARTHNWRNWPGCVEMDQSTKISVIKHNALETFQLLYKYGILTTGIVEAGIYGRYDIVSWLLKEKYTHGCWFNIVEYPQKSYVWYIRDYYN